MTAAKRIRLSPEARREQLLELGVQMLTTRTLDELSVEALAEQAGISRGLLFHYFRNKQDFHRAVVQRAADDLIETTAPGSRPGPDPPADPVAGALRRLRDRQLPRPTSRWSAARPAATRRCARSSTRPGRC